jgi:hypothetical protein
VSGIQVLQHRPVRGVRFDGTNFDALVELVGSDRVVRARVNGAQGAAVALRGDDLWPLHQGEWLLDDLERSRPGKPAFKIVGHKGVERSFEQVR